jgi:hypothetical protein
MGGSTSKIATQTKTLKNRYQNASPKNRHPNEKPKEANGERRRATLGGELKKEERRWEVVRANPRCRRQRSTWGYIVSANDASTARQLRVREQQRRLR